MKKQIPSIRIGNPYYSLLGGANITIGGGTATSTFSGDGGDDFYIGYGERRNSNNNVVTVSSNGVLTNVRDMFVGHVNNQQNASAINPSTANQLTVTGTGTASMRGLSVGYAQNAGTVSQVADANANVVEVTGGGSLSTTGAAYVGRANNNNTASNANTLTISGTGSSWNAGNQNVIVGFTSSATATSNDNILTVGVGASLTNVNNLTVGSGSGTETGNQLVVNGTLTASTVTVNAGNSLSGLGLVNGDTTLGGTLAPGQSPGTLGFGGDLTLTNGATYSFEAGDLVTVAGQLALIDNWTLALGSGFSDGGSVTIFTYGTSGGFDLAPTFDTSSLGFTPSGSLSLTDTGSSIVLNGINAVPEPRAALLGAIGVLFLLRRRR